MKQTTFSIPKMDCASEEQLIRMALAGRPEVRMLDADLHTRRLKVLHEGDPLEIAAVLAPLNLGAEMLETASARGTLSRIDRADEARTLWMVLGINAGMFFGELIGAYFADSSALLADSLDMFADAAVYGIALYGVHRTLSAQFAAARVTGILQLLLAIGAFVELGRRLIFGSEPEAPLMAGVAAVALAANVTSLWLLARHRDSGAHMKASWICTTTDVIANFGVIAAAGLVQLFQSAIPDLVAATVIAFVVFSGAVRILRLPG